MSYPRFAKIVVVSLSLPLAASAAASDAQRPDLGADSGSAAVAGPNRGPAQAPEAMAAALYAASDALLSRQLTSDPRITIVAPYCRGMAGTEMSVTRSACATAIKQSRRIP